MNAIKENLCGELKTAQHGLIRNDPWPWLRMVLGFGLFEAGYYFAYRFGMSFGQACAAPFWFPDSVLLCALLLARRRNWWIFILAPLPIRLFSEVAQGIPFWFLLVTFGIDSVKGLLTAVALRRFIRNPIQLETVQEFVLFCLIAVLLVPAVAAFGGAAARSYLGDDYWLTWEQWFMGNVLAQLVVTPAILYLGVGTTRGLRLSSKNQWIEAGFLAVGLMLTCYLAFRRESVRIGLTETRFYAHVPFLFWAAIRFGMLGAASGIVIVACISVYAAVHSYGPFVGLSPTDTALSLQHFLLLRAAPLYLVAILIEQTKGAEAAAHEQRMELVHLARVSTMGHLASALAHEVNQPLGAILRNAEAGELILQQNPPDYEEVRAILSDICQDDQRAGAVIDRMRSLLRRRNLEFESVSVKQLIDQVMMLVRAEMKARKVTLQVNVSKGLPLVTGDRVQLQQVMLNLLINGADAINDAVGEQRLLEVQVRSSDSQMLEIAVRDTGPGVPEEKLARIFEPFFTTKPNGMGMGLAISKTIVESHGGHIWAENNARGGATFRFTLKLAEEK